MPNESVYRTFSCMGLCGTEIAIPAKYAPTFIRANGTMVAGAYLVCDNCDTWIRDQVEAAHQFTRSDENSIDF
jgi:hypothetical protein